MRLNKQRNKQKKSKTKQQQQNQHETYISKDFIQSNISQRGNSLSHLIVPISSIVGYYVIQMWMALQLWKHKSS